MSQLLSGNRPRFTFVNADIIAAALNSADQDAEYFRTGRLSPRRIFSSRVEAEICECGGVIGADTLYGTVYK
ncbi:MAG: hypothetical protein OXI91_10270 [Chloroflexota bacterium]|nr:hypothetical protein [Chloroflexota bacterium]